MHFYHCIVHPPLSQLCSSIYSFSCSSTITHTLPSPLLPCLQYVSSSPPTCVYTHIMLLERKHYLSYPTFLIYPLTCRMPLERWRMMALRVLNHARRCGSLTPSSMGRSPAHNEQYIIHIHQMDPG